MIDFRYHIVSLIAVFMALAVGIVIGAGPLRDYLADELSGQVDQLRVEKEEQRIALEESEATAEQQSEFISGAAPTLLSDTLTDRTVAVVQLPEADPDVVEAVSERLEESGASIAARAALTETWTDPGQRAFRSGIAGNIAAYLNPQPADDAAAEQTLGAALGQALTLRDPDNLSTSSTEAQAMYDLLISSELIEEISEPSGPAYATVVIGDAQAPANLDTAAEMNTVVVSTMEGLVDTGEGNVLAAGGDQEGDLLAEVRSTDSINERLTTVDTIDEVAGQVTVPAALAADIAGNTGAFGLQESAAASFPHPVSLPGTNPGEFAPGSPDTPPEDDEGSDGGADGAGANDEDSDGGADGAQDEDAGDVQ